MNRDLDAEIAEKVLGWKPVRVGNDADGTGACEILWHTENPGQDFYNTLPLKGTVHRGFRAPQFSHDIKEAIKLAVRVGLKLDISELDFSDYQFPETLTKRALDHWFAPVLNG